MDNVLAAGSGCTGTGTFFQTRADALNGVSGFSGTDRKKSVSLQTCDDTADPGIRLCSDMEGTATYCRDITGAIGRQGVVFCGGNTAAAVGGQNYGTISFNLFLKTPPAPNQTGGC